MKLILWCGLVYKSLEYCKVQKQPDGFNVEAVIVGYYQNKFYKLQYRVCVDQYWRAHEFKISSEIDGEQKYIIGNKVGDSWSIDHNVRPELNGLLYIDISLTPLTNTLPINNLLLEIGESKEINVLYIDVLNNEIKPIRQHYTRKAKDLYLYENFDFDFSATIQVDPNGFVKDYSGLFEAVPKF